MGGVSALKSVATHGVSELLAVTSALFGSDGFGGGKAHADTC
jgi:hypothetical protein